MTLTLTFNPLRVMVRTYSRANVQGHWSVGSEDRIETNGQMDIQTDGGDCITSLANAVSNSVKALNKTQSTDGSLRELPTGLIFLTL